MTDIPPADPDKQLETWRLAVDALGGQHATARALDMSARSVNRLFWGNYPLHDGILQDTAAALSAHAKLCRELERQLSPAYLGNLTEHQRKRDMRGRARSDREDKADG